MKQDSIIENKPLLTQSRLFLEVSGVIGKVAALEELTLAYREYRPTTGYPVFNWDVSLIDAFEWEFTLQGDDFWEDVYQGTGQ